MEFSVQINKFQIIIICSFTERYKLMGCIDGSREIKGYKQALKRSLPDNILSKLSLIEKRACLLAGEIRIQLHII